MQIVDTGERFLVILADRHRGRFFTIAMDTFEDQGEELLDNVHRNVKANKGSMHRHVQEELNKHLKHVGKKAQEYLLKRHITAIGGVIIGGHKELLHAIKQYLPPELKKNVIAECITELGLPVGEMTEKVKQQICAGAIAAK